MKTSINYADLRRRLVDYARRRVPSAVAEDLAQDALLLTLQKQPLDPLAYAFGVIKKLIRRANQMSQRALVAELQQPLPAADEYLDRVENYGRLGVALEHVLVWGNQGKTSLTVASVSNARIMNTVAEYTASRCVLDELPYTRQHRARLCKKFDLAIAEAFHRCEFRIDPNHRQRTLPFAPPETPSESDSIHLQRVPLAEAGGDVPYKQGDGFMEPVAEDRHEPAADIGPSPGIWAIGGPKISAYRIEDPLLSRALDVVLRFSKISKISEGIVVAERAVLAAAEKLDR